MEGCQNKEYIIILVCNRCVVQELPEPEMLSLYLTTFSSLNLSCSVTNENFWHQNIPWQLLKSTFQLWTLILFQDKPESFFNMNKSFHGLGVSGYEWSLLLHNCKGRLWQKNVCFSLLVWNYILCIQCYFQDKSFNFLIPDLPGK